MRALVWTAPYQAVVRDEPVPAAGPDSVVLDVVAAGVCGSDLHGYRGHSPQRVAPLILGHEVVARDEAGAQYVVNPLIGCGRCAACEAGSPNLCPRRGLLGMDRPGAFAEKVSVPEANLSPLPAGLSPVAGTLVEPLAAPINALRGTQLGEGSVVVVIGCGPIGLLAIRAARRQGAGTIAAYDLDAERAARAASTADITGSSPEDVRAALQRAGATAGADVVVDAAGAGPTWRAAIELVKPGGTVAAIGLAAATADIPVGDIVRKAVTVRGVYAYTPDDFAAALELLADEPEIPEWVTEAELGEGPELLRDLSDQRGPVKAVFVRN